MTLGTRVAVMREGIVEQVAPALEVFRTPANVFVAGFVGSPAMNLWPATVEQGRLKAAPTVDVELGRLKATPPIDPQNATTIDGPVTIGIRPHEIELVAQGDADGSGLVEIVEPIGPTTVVHLRVVGLGDQLVRVVVPAETAVRLNDRVYFRLRRDGLQLFDAQSGEARR